MSDTPQAQAEDGDIVRAVTDIVREADRVFQQVGGSSRHWVRDCFLPLLNHHGWFVVKRVACPCGHGDEPWHCPRNGFCSTGMGRHGAEAAHLQGSDPMTQKIPKALDAIADTVLRYRPKARSEPARQRKRRKTILEKKRKKSDA